MINYCFIDIGKTDSVLMTEDLQYRSVSQQVRLGYIWGDVGTQLSLVCQFGPLLTNRQDYGEC